MNLKIETDESFISDLPCSLALLFRCLQHPKENCGGNVLKGKVMWFLKCSFSLLSEEALATGAVQTGQPALILRTPRTGWRCFDHWKDPLFQKSYFFQVAFRRLDFNRDGYLTEEDFLEVLCLKSWGLKIYFKK